MPWILRFACVLGKCRRTALRCRVPDLLESLFARLLFLSPQFRRRPMTIAPCRGPLQYVQRDGLGGHLLDNVDMATWNMPTAAASLVPFASTKHTKAQAVALAMIFDLLWLLVHSPRHCGTDEYGDCNRFILNAARFSHLTLQPPIQALADHQNCCPSHSSVL